MILNVAINGLCLTILIKLYGVSLLHIFLLFGFVVATSFSMVSNFILFETMGLQMKNKLTMIIPVTMKLRTFLI